MIPTHLMQQFNEAVTKKHINEDQKIHPLQELANRIRSSGSEEEYGRLLINAIEKAAESAIEENIKILIAELHSIKESEYWDITNELPNTRSITLYFLNYAYAPKIHAVELHTLQRYFADNGNNPSIISELQLSVKQALLSLLVGERIQDFKNIFGDKSEEVISQIFADENLKNWKAPNGKTAIELFQQEFFEYNGKQINITELFEAVEKGDYSKVKEVLSAVKKLKLNVDEKAKSFISILINLLAVANRAYEKDYIHISVCHALIEALQVYYSINSFNPDRAFNRIFGKIEMPIEIELISYMYELLDPNYPNWRESARQQLVKRLADHFRSDNKFSKVEAMSSLEKIALLYLLTEKQDYFAEIFGKEKDVIIAMLLNDKRLAGFQYVAKSGDLTESFSLLNRAIRHKRNNLLPLLVKAGYHVYSTEGLDGRSTLFDAITHNIKAIDFLAQHDANKKLPENPSYNNYDLWKLEDIRIHDLLIPKGYTAPTEPTEKGFFASFRDGIRSLNISLTRQLPQTPYVQSVQEIILKDSLKNGSIEDVKNCILNKNFYISVENFSEEETSDFSDVQNEAKNNQAYKKTLFFALLEAWQERSYARYRRNESKHLMAYLDEYDVTKFSFLFEPKFLKSINVNELQALSFAARITCAFFLAKLANEEAINHFALLYKAEKL